jgi:hypothetical protein
MLQMYRKGEGGYEHSNKFSKIHLLIFLKFELLLLTCHVDKLLEAVISAWFSISKTDVEKFLNC